MNLPEELTNLQSLISRANLGDKQAVELLRQEIKKHADTMHRHEVLIVSKEILNCGIEIEKAKHNDKINKRME